MPSFLVHSGRQMTEALAMANHPNLRMQYDINHMTMVGEEPARFIPAHAAAIGHIQFTNAPGRGAPGTGKIDVETLFQIIDDCGYAG